MKFPFKLRSILEVHLLNFKLRSIPTGSKFSKLTYTYIFNLRSIFEGDFQYWCIYFETLKYIWSTLSKFMKYFLKYTLELQNKYINIDWKPTSSILLILKRKRSISNIYFLYTSEFEVEIKYSWSINKVPFLSFPIFILHLFFFLRSSLKASVRNLSRFF